MGSCLESVSVLVALLGLVLVAMLLLLEELFLIFFSLFSLSF